MSSIWKSQKWRGQYYSLNNHFILTLNDNSVQSLFEYESAKEWDNDSHHDKQYIESLF